MELGESLRMSWRSIRGHKLRSTLTTIGVVIGVAAVIVFVTLGVSLQSDIVGEVAGSQQPVMSLWVGPDDDGPPGSGAQPVFTGQDIDRLEATPGVSEVLPRGQVATAGLSQGAQATGFGGVTATPPAAFNRSQLAEGRVYQSGQQEVLLNDAAATLFEPNATVGDSYTLALADGRVLDVTVVGILNSTSEGSVASFGGDAPQVFVPIEPFYSVTRQTPGTNETRNVYPFVTVNADNFTALSVTEQRVQSYLQNGSEARQLKPESYVFNVQTNQELVDRLDEIISTFTDFIVGVATISLIVGSIGIANIMLVSVTERTREIGIMKATGARRRDILQLFITEAVLLGVIGAVLGAIVGAIGGYVATDYVEIALTLDPGLFAGAIAVGISVGVLAGAYPAWRAAKTDPIDALRYE
jgi:putative ABC transport system permease protein